MHGERRARNPDGLHLLVPGIAAELVRASGVGPDDLVLDLGAGTGALTGPLAGTGARVLAVERSPRLARRLERRYAESDRVRVVESDMRALRLPRRPYRVVANLPFSITMTMLGLLLDDRDGSLRRADLVVPWHVAVRVVAEDRPRTRRWRKRYRLDVARKLPRRVFRPPPSVAAAVLVVERLRR